MRSCASRVCVQQVVVQIHGTNCIPPTHNSVRFITGCWRTEKTFSLVTRSSTSMHSENRFLVSTCAVQVALSASLIHSAMYTHALLLFMKISKLGMFLMRADSPRYGAHRNSSLNCVNHKAQVHVHRVVRSTHAKAAVWLPNSLQASHLMAPTPNVWAAMAKNCWGQYLWRYFPVHRWTIPNQIESR